LSEKPADDSEVGSLGFALALVYGTGLSTTNVFLSSLGLADFSLIKPKAIFTGAIVLGTLALLGIGPTHVLASLLDRNHPPPRPLTRWFFAKSAAKVVLPIVVVTWMCWVAGRPPWTFLNAPWYKPSSPSESWRFAVGLYLSSVVTYALAIQSVRSFKAVRAANSFPGIATRLAKLTLLLAGALIGLSCYINVFATTLYTVLPQAIGGGSPEMVRFIVQNDSVADLRNLGIAFIDDKTSLTEPLLVVYESDDFIGVVVKTQEQSPAARPGVLVDTTGFVETVRLDKRAVKGAVVNRQMVSRTIIE
jgi:hypothetical protein